MLSGLENPVHLLIVLTIVLLVFGAKRLPEIGRSLGRGMREFRAGVTGTERDVRDVTPPAGPQSTYQDQPVSLETGAQRTDRAEAQ
jgi:sec-independent protein translocase protein TatA